MIKIIFIDFDNTLFSHETNSIPSSAIDALNMARKNGIKIFICSGRSICELDAFDLSKVTFDGMIGNNGQNIYDENKKLIYDCPIDGVLKEKMLEKFNSKHIPIFINTGDDIFTNFVNEKVIETQNIINSPIPRIKEYEGEKIYMCSAFYKNSSEFEILSDIKNIAKIVYWHDGAVDIIPKDASKANGIERAIKLLNIKPEETMGIGDASNDIDMLKFCDIGVAMGNSNEEIKKSADYVTSHIEHDGIYNALKYFNLI